MSAATSSCSRQRLPMTAILPVEPDTKNPYPSPAPARFVLTTSAVTRFQRPGDNISGGLLASEEGGDKDRSDPVKVHVLHYVIKDVSSNVALYMLTTEHLMIALSLVVLMLRIGNPCSL